MNPYDLKKVRRDGGAVLQLIDKEFTMVGLPWPTPDENSGIATVDVIIEKPTWVWDDVNNELDPKLISEDSHAKLVVSRDYGTIWIGGKLVGRY